MKRKKKIQLIIACVLLVFVVLFGGKILQGASILYNILFNKDIDLKQEDGAVNILLMGIGGGQHEGPELTDTVMVANVNAKTNLVTLISIPRDLWVPELEHKINYGYALGQAKNQQGLLLSRKVVEKVTGLSINYAFVIDFAGFEKFVDHIDGVDVNVQRTLDDPEYPIAGKEDDPCDHTEEELAELATASSQLEAFPCRYTHVYFEKGQRHMSGQDALRFVRSRHAKGGEGTDFARSQRQQQVIMAIREKVLSIGMLLNPVKVYGMYDIVRDNINTDIDTNEIDDFVKLAQKMQNATIRSYVIDQGDDVQDTYGLLENPVVTEEYNFQWVLTPRKGNGEYSEINSFVDCVLTGAICEVRKDAIITITPTPSVSPQ